MKRLLICCIGLLGPLACWAQTAPADAPAPAAAAAAAEPAAAPVRFEPPPPQAGAEFPPWLQAQRERVAARRQAVSARYEAREFACWRRFAVNACLAQARQERRDDQAVLRREELALNVLERQHRTEGRLRAIDEKQQERLRQQSEQADGREPAPPASAPR